MSSLKALFVIFFIVVPESLQDNNYTVNAANQYISAKKINVDRTYRMKYHFMAPIGWINDPNGFIYYKDEYHLFYQFNPYDSIPNKIHWGHAKSRDLIYWEDLPVALAPDQIYDEDGVFSGSAIEKDGKLYVIYTGFSKLRGQVQCIAVSDDGITFKKISENPVLDHKSLPSNARPEDFRDPKIFKRANIFYVVIASKTLSNTGQILLYQSSDLIKWSFKSILLEGTAETGVMWECPDLFELEGKDVLLLSAIEMPQSGNDYRNYDSVIEFIGRVNWTTGKMTFNAMKEIDHGMDFYATQSLLDSKQRRIVIAWMNMWGRNYPTHTFNHGWTGAMTIPRQLRLKNGFIAQTPACDFDSVFKNVREYQKIIFNNEMKEFDQVLGAVGVLDLLIILGENAVFTIELRKSASEKTVITYDKRENVLILDRSSSGHLLIGVETPQVLSRKVSMPLDNSRLKFRILLDQSSVEVFANDGAETMTANIYPTKENSVGIRFRVQGTAVLEKVRFSFSGSFDVLPTNLITILIPSYILFNI